MNLNLSINNILNLSEIEKKNRQQSLDNFLVSGFPNKKLEDWKFTDFNQIISAQFYELKFYLFLQNLNLFYLFYHLLI